MLRRKQTSVKNQYGFRKGFGNIDTLYNVSKYIYKALQDNCKKTTAVFLNFAKAFDTVDHKLLLNSLPDFGIINGSLKWFTSYHLKDRTQYVSLYDQNSDERKLNFSVPQGSVFGPILLIMYINSFCNMEIVGTIITYTDDTCLLFSDKTWDRVHNNTGSELNRFIHKLNFKKITINYDKTVFIAFSLYL